MYKATKRLTDVVVSLIVLIISLPVFLIVMLLLRLTGDGEVFYLQERVGYKNRKFRIIKFATMIKDGDKIGNGEFTVKNDPRLRPFGKVLRKTKLNELPQIINILKGDMTLIGPRPLMGKGFERYSREVQNIIYNIRPGLTGIGSIIFRDEETIVSHFTDLEKVYRNINRYKGQLEIWYQKKQSFKTDMLIVFLTAYSIVFPTQHITFDVFKDLPVIEKDELNLSVMLFRNRPIAKKVERRSPVAM
jgi:lipopolysaccharide/colanic/teichoic acid biosynthesis glycosyltransferase